MPIKRFDSSISVLDAAKMRIRNLFACGCKVYLSFSCGKDSLCMSSLTYDLILAGEIDRHQLTVIFVDEEGLYPSMVDAAMRWREKFVAIGVPFHWLCLPLKQYPSSTTYRRRKAGSHGSQERKTCGSVGRLPLPFCTTRSWNTPAR